MAESRWKADAPCLNSTMTMRLVNGASIAVVPLLAMFVSL
jgi:hypothetical protein